MRVILVTNLITGQHEIYSSIPKVLDKYRDFVGRTMGEKFRNGKPYLKGTIRAQRMDVL